MKNTISRTVGIALLCMVIQACSSEPPADEESGSATGLIEKRWPEEKAWEWYRNVAPIRGVHYLPRTAVNVSEVWSRGEDRSSMWRAAIFDPETLDRETGWAQNAGYNSIRIFLDYPVWKADPDGLKERMDEFLAIAARHEIRTVFVLLRDVSISGQEIEEPAPDATDRSIWPDLEAYLKDVLGRFGEDDRILMWDLYNEPDRNLSLVEATFTWARGVNPSQPLTTGAWTAFDSGISRRLMELSDVVSFHTYDPPETVRAKIEQIEVFGRPLVCTEFLRRQAGNTFEAILPIFAEHKIGWYSWGLVARRVPTFWGSKQSDAAQAVWQTDVFHADGRPYNNEEIELVRNFTFEP